MAALKPAYIRLSIGHGVCAGHHGEIVQGLFHAPHVRDPHPAHDPPFARGLLTLPCPLFWSSARFIPHESPGGALEVTPPGREKARRAAVLTARHLGLTCGGRLDIRSNIPPGRGLGSSTADVVAAIRAVADCCGARLSADVVAGLAVQAETAADAVMYAESPRSEAVLFAQRAGRVIEAFGRPLPPLVVLGFDTAEWGGAGLPAGVDTLRLPLPDYTPAHIAEFERLRDLLRRGIRSGDPRMIAEAAVRSAIINQTSLPTPGFADWLRVSEQAGALGAQVAHSGTVVGLLFDPAASDLATRLSRARRWLNRLGVQTIWRYATG